jgi:hypothetical protein
MSKLCVYGPCKCLVPDDEQFCGDVCAMLGAGLVNRVSVSSTLRVKEDAGVTPRCACGHDGCGDSLVSDSLN